MLQKNNEEEVNWKALRSKRVLQKLFYSLDLTFCLLIFILKFSKWVSEKFPWEVINLSLERKLTFSPWLLEKFNLIFLTMLETLSLNSSTAFLSQSEFLFSSVFPILLPSLSYREHACKDLMIFSDTECHNFVKTRNKMAKYLKAITKI